MFGKAKASAGVWCSPTPTRCKGEGVAVRVWPVEGVAIQRAWPGLSAHGIGSCAC